MIRNPPKAGGKKRRATAVRTKHDPLQQLSWNLPRIWKQVRLIKEALHSKWIKDWLKEHTSNWPYSCFYSPKSWKNKRNKAFKFSGHIQIVQTVTSLLPIYYTVQEEITICFGAVSTWGSYKMSWERALGGLCTCSISLVLILLSISITVQTKAFTFAGALAFQSIAITAELSMNIDTLTNTLSCLHPLPHSVTHAHLNPSLCLFSLF